MKLYFIYYSLRRYYTAKPEDNILRIDDIDFN